MKESPTSSLTFNLRINKLVSYSSFFAALFFLPFIFSFLCSTGQLRVNEKNGLWIVFSVLFLFGIVFLIRKEKIQPGKSLFYFSILILLFVELFVRIGIKLFAGDQTRKSLEDECNYTYPQNGAYVGHPFTQFIGQPDIALKGTRALGNLSPYNNYGFVGKDFSINKPANVIRIACLGESTTADGYPGFLEEYINQNKTNKKINYEVYNFGHAYWTTAHSMITFLLTVLDFKPDYVVIHHGWNEEKIRDAQPGEFRGDYSHAFKAWDPPYIYDRYMIRTSVIYRFFKFKYDKSPEWTSLGGYITKKRARAEPLFQNQDELKPFKRNIENEIIVALANNIKPVLTTLPHSTDQNIAMYYGFVSIDQCNAITREIAKEYEGKIIFVDIDSVLTAKRNDIFVDLGHVTDEGRKIKAQLIGNKILFDSKEKEGDKSTNSIDVQSHEEAIKMYIEKIKSYAPWLESVKQKAKEKNITLDVMLRMDAEYLLSQDSLKKKSLD